MTRETSVTVVNGIQRGRKLSTDEVEKNTVLFGLWKRKNTIVFKITFDALFESSSAKTMADRLFRGQGIFWTAFSKVHGIHLQA